MGRWVTINGNRVFIDDSAPPKKPGKAGPVIAAAVLAGLMAAAGGAGVTGSVGAALDSASTQASEQSTDADTARSKEAASEGDETDAWTQMGVKVLKESFKERFECAVQSYGQIQQFFLRTPCKSLKQRLLLVSDLHGDLAVVSIVWVQMAAGDDADQLEHLEDTYGTGDITPIATQVLQLVGIKFTARYYASRTDDSLVVVAETEPVHGQPSHTFLDDVASVASVLPPPRDT